MWDWASLVDEASAFPVADAVSAAPAVANVAGSADYANAALSAFNTAANVYGKVATADIMANARYPMYGMGLNGQMYQTRSGALTISPMLLLLIAGAVYMMKE